MIIVVLIHLMTLLLVPLQSTEDGHVDKLNLGTAINTMTNIASYINEYKRRKDLGKSYEKNYLNFINLFKVFNFYLARNYHSGSLLD